MLVLLKQRLLLLYNGQRHIVKLLLHHRSERLCLVLTQRLLYISQPSQHIVLMLLHHISSYQHLNEYHYLQKLLRYFHHLLKF